MKQADIPTVLIISDMEFDECGVSLISGFSPNTMNMVMNGSIESDGNEVHTTKDPYESMVNVLNGERYAQIKIA